MASAASASYDSESYGQSDDDSGRWSCEDSMQAAHFDQD